MDIKLFYKPSLHKKIAVPFIMAVVVVLIGSYFLFGDREDQLALNTAYQQAKTVFKMIVITRQWVAERRDEVKPIPAIATKELAVYAKRLSNIRFHITSDHPIDSDNRPDKFEKSAMIQFKKGKKEVYEIVDTKRGKIYRYMAPIFINKACINCHANQGYSIGDLKGGISVSIPLAPIYKSISKNKKFFLGFIVMIGLLFLALVKILITRLVLIPVSKLDRVASEISHGNYSMDIQIHNNDELGALAETFRNMSKKISHSQSELQKKVYKATKELKIANECLNKNASIKSELYSTLAHDIRTPLAVILLGSEAIEFQLGKLGKNKEIVESIKNNANKLKHFFDNLLEIEKIENGILKIRHEKHDINLILKEVVSELLTFAQNQGVALRLNATGVLEANVDKEKLSVCMENIVSNAIKFSSLDTEVTAACYRNNQNNIVIEIADQGIGIAPDEIGKIFNKFYRTKRGTKKNRYGTGLGLSITKKFLEKMGGRIIVQSEMGKGTIVKIILMTAKTNTRK